MRSVGAANPQRGRDRPIARRASSLRSDAARSTDWIRRIRSAPPISRRPPTNVAENKQMLRLSISALVLASLCMCACQPPPEKHEEAGVFAVTTPLRKDTELTHEYVAQVRAIQHIEVRAQERGYLTEIFVDEGQQVREG